MEPKKAFKSFRYKNALVWKSARRGMVSALGKPSLEVGSPPEFRGEPGIWTPEDLLVGALNSCLMLTFLALAQSRSEEHTSELQSLAYLVCRLLLEKKK